MPNNQQNKNREQSDKGVVLQKILGDRISNRLLSRITILVIVLLVILRITLYFAMPSYYLHEHSDQTCTANFQKAPGMVCEIIDIQETTFWTSNLNDVSNRDMFVVVQGIGMRKPGHVEYEVFDMKYEYNYYEIKGKKNDRPDHHGQTIESNIKDPEERTIEIYCPKNEQICRFNDYIFVTDLGRGSLQLEIQLHIPDDKKEMFQAFQFTIWKGNEKIGKILTAFQYTFFSISVIMALIYIIHYCRISKNDRSFEHLGILILSLALILFNNPFYVISLYHSNTFFQILGAIFVCLFIILAFHFWIVVGRRVENREYQPDTIYADLKLKGALFITFLLLSLPSCVYNASDELHPAFYGHGSISMLLLIALILAVVTTGGFWIYILILFCQNLSQRRFVPQRYRNLIFVSVFFFVYMMFNFLTGFYHYNPSMPGRNIVYLFTVNLYIYFLQLMWRTQGDVIKITQNDEQPEESEKSKKEFVVRDFERGRSEPYEREDSEPYSRGQSEPYQRQDVEQDHFNLDKLELEEERVDQDETGEIQERDNRPTNMRRPQFQEDQDKVNKRQSYEFRN